MARYGPPVSPSGDEELEAAFERTNRAHDWLQRLESQLRMVIDSLMAKAFGPDWPKTHCPKDVYEDWKEKKRKAEKSGEFGLPLIAYADFTHYEKVICKRDNFREVFAPYFGQRESVRESLQRMYLPRVQTMHGRAITLEAELLLYAEIRRLMRLIEGLS